MDTITANPGRQSQNVRFLAALLMAVWIGSAGAQNQFNLGAILGDTWWNASESGWGVTVNHQEPVVFLTFFVYRADNSPYWVTGTLFSASPVGDTYMYTGDLYETHGPGFGPTFNPALVTYRKVGTASFATDIYTTTLTYVIDGVAVTKSLQRLTLRNLDFSGTYTGSLTYVRDSCTPSSLSGQLVAINGSLSITHMASSLTIVTQGTGLTCTFTGSYLQTGSLGNAQGTNTCSDGATGPLTIILMQKSPVGMLAALAGNDQKCSFVGSIGGLLRLDQ